MSLKKNTDSSIKDAAFDTAFDAMGWYKKATKIPSPNCNDRPANEDISLIVIHCICLPPLAAADQSYANNGCVEQFFCNELDSAEHPYFEEIKGLEVSAHFYIKRSGEIVQFVSTEKRAWHAGKSTFDGRENCNDYSVGIELQGMEDDIFTEDQYRNLSALCRQLMGKYPKITKTRVTGHSDIAPGRKTDPGTGFDWVKLRASL